MEERATYRPELDVLRFLAFAMVFVHHVVPRASRGGPVDERTFVQIVADATGFGMTLFFLLSAYLLTSLFLVERERHGRIGIGAFYVRRILRIWPLYFLGLGIGVAIEQAAGADPAAPSMFRSFWVFLGNWHYQDHAWGRNPMEPLWSISVEEQFYLLLPAVLLLAGRWPFLAGAAVAGLGCVATYAQGAAHLSLDTAIWSNTFTHFIAFGTGMMLAARWHDRPAGHGVAIRIAAFAAAAVLFVVAVAPFEGKGMDAATGGLPVLAGHVAATAACAALLVAVRDWRALAVAPLVGLGKISYGLYVWHLYALSFAATVLGNEGAGWIVAGFFLTIVFAMLSYRCFERPFLFLKQRWVVVPSRPV